MGKNHFSSVPTTLYGVVLLLAAIAYYILQTTIVCQHGRESKLATALGRNFKGKISPVLYAVAIPLSFFRAWIAGAIYVFVSLMWLVPDRRLARVLEESRPAGR